MAKHPKESSGQSVSEDLDKIDEILNQAQQQIGNESVAQQYPQGQLVAPLESSNAIGAATGSLSGIQAAPRKPSIGRIVIFTDNYKPTEKRAAFVTAVRPGGLVNLVVLDDSQNPPTQVFKGVAFSDNDERGTWNWPVIV